MFTRTLLWIGEEGAILYHYKRKKMILRHFLLHPQPLKSLLTGKKLEILIDTLPMRFVHAPFPKCPLFDRQKTLMQCLEAAFYPDSLRNGKILKNQTFYGICLSESPLLSQWFKVLKEEGWIVKRIVSMAVESASLFSGTRLVVSPTKKGNLRQVFFHQGHALFTRYYKIPESPDKTSLIEKEVSATLMYLERHFMLPAKTISLSYFPPLTEEDLVETYLKKAHAFLSLLPQEFRYKWLRFLEFRNQFSAKLTLGIAFTGFILFSGYYLWSLKPPVSLKPLHKPLKKASLPKPLTEEKSLYLGAVMAFSSSQWTVWINGKPLRSTETPKDIHVQDIQNGQARIHWYLEGEKHEFLIRSNQTYCANCKRVMQGKGCRKITSTDTIEPHLAEAGLYPSSLKPLE